MVAVLRSFKLTRQNVIRFLILFTTVTFWAITSQGSALVQALSSNQTKALQEQVYYFNTEADTCQFGGGSTVSLSGNDNEQKAYNFFVSQGLTPVQAAGFVGNLIGESGVRPNADEQKGTASSPTPGDGFGIVQWTTASRQQNLVGYAAQQGQPVTNLAVQLAFAWQEFTTSYKSDYQALKTATTTQDATNDVMVHYEAPEYPATDLPIRVNFANEVLQLYGGSVVTASSASSSCQGGLASANCNTASGASVTGNAKIACDVLQYDSLSYSQAWHSSGSIFHSRCPSIGPQCATDCSGLVNIALYDVFNNNMNETTYGEAADTTNFKQIPFGEVQPGDFIQPNPDHVEIIESVQGNTLHTFAAHTDNVAQPDQVGPALYTNSPGYVYLRYIGQGSGT